MDSLLIVLLINFRLPRGVVVRAQLQSHMVTAIVDGRNDTGG
jgi:hypothetical protein